MNLDAKILNNMLANKIQKRIKRLLGFILGARLVQHLKINHCNPQDKRAKEEKLYDHIN